MAKEININTKPEIQIDPDVYRMAAGLFPAHVKLDDFINDTLTAGLSLELAYYAKEGADDSPHAHMNVLEIVA